MNTVFQWTGEKIFLRIEKTFTLILLGKFPWDSSSFIIEASSNMKHSNMEKPTLVYLVLSSVSWLLKTLTNLATLRLQEKTKTKKQSSTDHIIVLFLWKLEFIFYSLCAFVFLCMPCNCSPLNIPHAAVQISTVHSSARALELMSCPSDLLFSYHINAVEIVLDSFQGLAVCHWMTIL